MTVKVAVIYYSATGTVRALARAVADGARSAGAEVRLRSVAEHAAEGEAAAGETRAGETPAGEITAELDDLAWADAFAFGTPTRFGTPAAQLKQFIDGSVGLWKEGRLADKPVTAFTSAHNRHGGSEATILSLGNVFYHWGGIIVPPGYTDPIEFEVGNPYGASFVSGGTMPDDIHLEAARYQAQRVTEVARLLKRGRAAA